MFLDMVYELRLLFFICYLLLLKKPLEGISRQGWLSVLLYSGSAGIYIGKGTLF